MLVRWVVSKVHKLGIEGEIALDERWSMVARRGKKGDRSCSCTGGNEG